MSGAQITRLPTGQIRVSRIIYITDMLRSDTREIPVGVIGEITLPTLLGIGTAIRPAFTDIELSLMGPTARAIVTAPREKLWPSVKESLTVAPKGLALELLSSQHSSSLSILSPYAIKVPKQWLVQRDPNRLIQLVRERMPSILTDEYFDFLFPPRDDGVPDPQVEEEVRQAA